MGGLAEPRVGRSWEGRHWRKTAPLPPWQGVREAGLEWCEYGNLSRGLFDSRLAFGRLSAHPETLDSGLSMALNLSAAHSHTHTHRRSLPSPLDSCLTPPVRKMPLSFPRLPGDREAQPGLTLLPPACPDPPGKAGHMGRKRLEPFFDSQA